MAPALLTRMSTSGKAANTLSTLVPTERSAAITSTRTLDLRAIAALAASRSAWVRDTRTTLQPSCAIPTAVARPMPFEPPVISAVLPARLRSICLPFEIARGDAHSGRRPYDPVRAARNRVPARGDEVETFAPRRIPACSRRGTRQDGGPMKLTGEI